jgi:hypothetical protein
MIVCAPAITAVIVALAIAAPEQVGASHPPPLSAIALAFEGSGDPETASVTPDAIGGLH